MKGTKKFGAKLLGVVIACSLGMTALTGWAAVVPEYAVGGEATSGPIPGAVTVSAEVSQRAQMRTAVFDDKTGCLVDMKISELAETSGTLTNNLNLTTMDGYTVKNYIWGGDSTLVPLADVPRTNNLIAKVFGHGLRVEVSWKELAKDDATASYAVMKDGVLLPGTVDKEKAVYIDRDDIVGNHTYRVFAMDAAGVMISASQEVSITLEDPNTLPCATLDVDNSQRQAEADGDGKNLYTWDGSITDYTEAPLMQVTKTGRVLTKATEPIISGEKTYLYTALKDTWNAVTNYEEDVEGRSALMTSWHMRDQDADETFEQARAGQMMFKVGNIFEPTDNRIDITIEYLDQTAGQVDLQYVNSSAATKGSKRLEMAGTGGWKSYTFELKDAYFNSGIDTGLLSICDFMLLPQTTDAPLFINSIKVEAVPQVFLYDATLDVNRVQRKAADGTGVQNLYTWDSSIAEYADAPIKQVTKTNKVLTKAVEPIVKDETTYYYTAEADTWNVVTNYEENVDQNGNNALLTAQHIRVTDNATRDGQMIFDIGDMMRTADKEMDITVKYLDTMAGKVILKYFTGSNTTKDVALDMEGKGGWQTHTFELKDIVINDAANAGAWSNTAGDLMFLPQKGVPFFLNSIQVTVPESNEGKEDILYPNGVSCMITADGFTANGANFRYLDATQTDWDTASHYLGSVMDSKGVSKEAVATASYGYNGAIGKNQGRPTALYFDIADEYMFGEKDMYAMVEFDYLDHSERMMYIQYNGLQGTEIKTEINKEIGRQTNSGEWKKASIVLTNACFSNLWQAGAPHGASDFRIGTSIPGDEEMETNAGTLQDQLVIANLTVKNISHKTISHSDGVPSIYIAGDSIAADYAADAAPTGITGWGMTLRNQLKNGADVRNYAVPGTSTGTFANFDAIENGLYKNDYVFISFGHNDADTNPEKGRFVSVPDYKANLITFIKKVQENQAIPVVLSSIPVYDADNETFTDNIGDYRVAAQEAANETGASFIDLYAGMVAGIGDNARACYVNDNVHLTEQGANIAAEVIVDALKNDAKIRVLKDYLK